VVGTFLENRLNYGGVVVRLTLRPHFTPPPPQEDYWYSFLLRVGVDPRAIMRLEGLGKLKKRIHLIGTRSRYLPACSIVPQPIILPRAPNL
jgi:hypothetical protein